MLNIFCRTCKRFEITLPASFPGHGFPGVIDEIDYFYPEDGTEDWCFLWFGYTGGNYKGMTRYMLKINGPVFSLSTEDVFLSKLNMLRRSSRVRLNVFQAASLVHELFGALKNKLDQDPDGTDDVPRCRTGGRAGGAGILIVYFSPDYVLFSARLSERMLR